MLARQEHRLRLARLSLLGLNINNAAAWRCLFAINQYSSCEYDKQTCCLAYDLHFRLRSDFAPILASSLVA